MAKYDGWVYFTGQQKWCVIEMERNLQYLLSSIYVMDHFDEGYLAKVPLPTLPLPHSFPNSILNARRVTSSTTSGTSWWGGWTATPGWTPAPGRRPRAR